MTKTNNITFADIENFEDVEKEMNKIENEENNYEDDFDEDYELPPLITKWWYSCTLYYKKTRKSVIDCASFNVA